MYESYQKDSKIPEYKDKTKPLKILLILSIIVFALNERYLKDIFKKNEYYAKSHAFR